MRGSKEWKDWQTAGCCWLQMTNVNDESDEIYHFNYQIPMVMINLMKFNEIQISLLDESDEIYHLNFQIPILNQSESIYNFSFDYQMPTEQQVSFG